MWRENARPRTETRRERYLALLGGGIFGAPGAAGDGVVADAGGSGADADGADAGGGGADADGADAAGVGAPSRSGGQGSSCSFSVARSTNTKRVARGLAGNDTTTRAIAFGTRLGLSCKGRRLMPGDSSAAISGKSQRTRSINSRPIQSSSAKRPMRRGVEIGFFRVCFWKCSTLATPF